MRLIQIWIKSHFSVLWYVYNGMKLYFLPSVMDIVCSSVSGR
jgi:hypothetical protein